MRFLSAVLAAILTGVFSGLLGAKALAEPLTMEQMLIEKRTRTSQPTDSDVVYVGFKSADHWCKQVPHGVDISSFAAARSLENLSLGLYQCRGEFVRVQGVSKIKVFAIETCVAQDPTELKKSCPSSL